MTARSLLDAPERHPIRPPDAVRRLGRTVVLAPHPDDESLGCGGLLALLAQAGCQPHVVVVTDGAQSHPGSAAYPPARLRALREEEAREAARHLGCTIGFLRQPDCGLPSPGHPAFDGVARRLAEAISAPRANEARAWRLDVSPVLDSKRRAVAAHRSQTTGLIGDDPDGFRLAPDVLAHFERTWELFLDPL